MHGCCGMLMYASFRTKRSYAYKLIIMENVAVFHCIHLGFSFYHYVAGKQLKSRN